MSDSNTALAEVPALLEERRRYETWLAALDARRDSTPTHVFDRVQSDYKGRLAAVAERLASHRHAIEEERANVHSRRSLLEAEEQMRRDERAELTLRAHVGELSETDSSSAFAAVDGSIDQLVSEKLTLDKRIAELDEMLVDGPPTTQNVAPAQSAPAEAAAKAEPPRPSEPEAPAMQTSPRPSGQSQLRRPFTPSGSFDDMAFLDSLVGGDASKRAATPAGQPQVVESLASTSGPPEREPALTADHQAAASDRESTPAVSTASITPPRAAAAVSRGGDREAELQHSSVAGDEPQPRESQPLALNVTGNRPIVLRPSGGVELSKTLKCNECGAMNYPTEWYCERCGAELAAL